MCAVYFRHLASSRALQSNEVISCPLLSKYPKRDASSLMHLHTTRSQNVKGDDWRTRSPPSPTTYRAIATGLWKSRGSCLWLFVTDNACLTSGHYIILITSEDGDPRLVSGDHESACRKGAVQILGTLSRPTSVLCPRRPQGCDRLHLRVHTLGCDRFGDAPCEALTVRPGAYV